MFGYRMDIGVQDVSSILNSSSPRSDEEAAGSGPQLEVLALQAPELAGRPQHKELRMEPGPPQVSTGRAWTGHRLLEWFVGVLGCAWNAWF